MVLARFAIVPSKVHDCRYISVNEVALVTPENIAHFRGYSDARQCWPDQSRYSIAKLP